MTKLTDDELHDISYGVERRWIADYKQRERLNTSQQELFQICGEYVKLVMLKAYGIDIDAKGDLDD